MAAFNSKPASLVFSRYWPWFFYAAAFESLLAINALLIVPTENGLTLARIGLLAILFVFFSAGIYLGFMVRRDSSRFDLEKVVRTPFILLSTLLFLTPSLFLLRYLDPEKLLPYYERLSPLLWYLFVIGIQTSIFLLLLKNGFHMRGGDLSRQKPVNFSAFIAFGILFFIILFVALTKLGITPDTAYWGEPGVAILDWQFVVSIALGFITLLFVLMASPYEKSPTLNVVIPLIIYIVASVLWLSVPVEVLQISFYAPISPPAEMPFPYSDAGFYNYISQNLLIGTDYFDGIPPRPLYVIFLVVLHFFFGQDYPAIIAAQTLVLAFFPVTLYFLGKKIHSPAAGVTVALFATFRELVSLWISSNTRVIDFGDKSFQITPLTQICPSP